jgi:ribosomal-protein-alanine N-acetyltransferase
MGPRPATLLDAQAMADLHQMCFDAPWSVDAFEDFLATDQAYVIGAPLQAFILARTTLDEAEILTLAVAPNKQRGGLASRLLEHSVAALAKQSVRRLFLEVACDNQGACALYLKFGFVQVGTRKGYYKRQNGTAVDAMILSFSVPGDN